MKARPQRKSIRLPGYDYSQPGAYFVTIVTYDRLTLFGSIENGEMILSKYGKIVHYGLLGLPSHYHHLKIDEICVMPNHLHAILWIIEHGRGGSSLSGIPNEPAGASLGEGYLPIAQTHALVGEADDSVIRGGFFPFGDEGLPTNVPDMKGKYPARETHPYKIYPLSEIIRGLKTFTARKINDWRKTPGSPVWQCNYYEHILRDEDELLRARRYILENPLRWAFDRENPSAAGYLTTKLSGSKG